MPIRPRAILPGEIKPKIKPRVIPVPVKKMRTQVRMQIQQAARVAGSFYGLLSKKMPEAKCTEGLRDAAKGKINAAKVSAKGNVYSMELTIKGEQRILSIKASANSLEFMLTNMQGKRLEYIKQQGNRLIPG